LTHRETYAFFENRNMVLYKLALSITRLEI
jgi:hypothetical protein